MARTRKARKTEPLLIRSLSVTPQNERLLQSLSQIASDELGWTVSKSALARALLRYVEGQPTAWIREHLFPLIEREIASGTVWGTKK